MGGQKSEKDGMLSRFGARQGAGAGQDYDLVRGRKQHRCYHHWANDYVLNIPCQHPVIEPGEWYVSTRQSWLEWEKLALECALASGILFERPDEGSAG